MHPGWLLAAVVAACPVVRAEGLAANIDRALAPAYDGKTTVGVVVIDPSDESILFQHNADTPFLPASNQKLFVMAAAIDILGPQFEFRTVIGMRGPHLVIIGDGDPAIGDPKLCGDAGVEITQVFDRWADALRQSGHGHITGDLVIDESIFDEQFTHPSWDPRDLQKWYAAPVGALNVNDNCIDVTVWPGSSAGGPVSWSVQPPVSKVDMINRAKSGGKGVPTIGRRGVSFTYVLDGRCVERATLPSLAVADPGLFFADALRTALTRRGVRIDGHLRRTRVRLSNGSLPPEFQPVAEHRTPLDDVLRRIGKNSQNLFADCLLKRIGHEFALRTTGEWTPGSWQNGADAVGQFLNRGGIDTDGLVIADASGLSRDNRVTARQLAAVLALMNRSPHRALFTENLAVAGIDGSLRRRMSDVAGRTRAKTGTMRGVKALSGYVETNDGGTLVFATVFNTESGPTARFKRIQDDICRIMAAQRTRVESGSRVVDQK